MTVIVAIGLSTGAAWAQNTIRWAAQGDALTLDPHAHNEGPTLALARQIHESLVQRDADLNLIPGLATDWRLVEPDIWEFDLRRDVTFHGGQTFTAQDVVFSLDRARSDNSDVKSYLDSVERVEAVDRHTIRIHTAGPNPILPDQLTEIYIMSAAWARENDAERPVDRGSNMESYATRHANGTGPFRVTKRQPDILTVLDRHAGWWGLDRPDAHNIDRIEYTPIGNAPTRVAALLSGKVDVLTDTPVQDIERLKRTNDISVQQTLEVRTIFLGLNVDDAALASSDVTGANPLADRRVRRALYHAINAKALQRVVMRGLAEPAGIVGPPQIRGYSKRLDQRLPFDPDQAKVLLAEAGYPDGFSLRLDCPNNRYVKDESICQAIVGMLARIGVTARLESVPKSQHFPKIEQRTTDFYLLGWGVPTLDSEYIFDFLARSDGPWNATGWADPEFDALVDKIAVETDQEQCVALMHRAWERLKEATVYLPLHHQMITWAMADRIDLPIQGDNQPQFRYARVD